MAAALTDGLSPHVRARFILLQQRFALGLPGRWLEIRDAGDRQSLRAALHRLAGSAASFGFERIGQRAREAEALVLQGADAALAHALALLESEIALIDG